MKETGSLEAATRRWGEVERLIGQLPEGFGHVGDLDAVVFVSDPAGEADARTTTTLLKLEQLLLSHGADPGRPRVVAEIFDARLAARREELFRTLGKHHVRIYSIPQLRAFFLFQSVVVPGRANRIAVLYRESTGYTPGRAMTLSGSYRPRRLTL